MRRFLAVLALSFPLLLVAGPAAGGGPTSVLLVVPGTGQTASLYVTDPGYSALAGMVGADGGGAGLGTAGSTGVSHESGTSVTVTWLIHDVQVWRVDRVFLSAEGGPWISTQSSVDGSTSLWDAPVTWHVAKPGAELVALLDRLGVGTAGGDVGEPDAGNVRTAADPGAAALSDQPATPGSEGTDGAPWAVAGLVVGAVSTLIGLRIRGRANPPAEDVMDEPIPGSYPAERLSSSSPLRPV